MTDKNWYVGPLGDLRPLTCPEPGMTFDEVRYGGVHQGLSGARTMDVTGHRSEYNFTWELVEKDEWDWLKALHTRLIPGPVRLLNPLFGNRLTTQASRLEYSYRPVNGTRFSSGHLRKVADWPDVLSAPGYFSLEWVGRTVTDAYVRFDERFHTPVFEGEHIYGSCVFKSDSSHTIELTLDTFDRFNQRIDSLPTNTFTLTSDEGWTVAQVDGVIPSGVAAVQLAFVVTEKDGGVSFAAPYVGGQPADPWEQGGAAATVLVDQLSTSSPRFPLTDCSMTLLEA